MDDVRYNRELRGASEGARRASKVAGWVSVGVGEREERKKTGQ